MADLQNSLKDVITTKYTVFERDQVLTEAQLNGVVQYLDVGERLARVELIGVGIACGLRVSLTGAGNQVTLTKGTGVTTDGDLVAVLADTVYPSFRARPATARGYDKLKSNGVPVPAWELVADAADTTATKLVDFAATTGVALSATTALILVETCDEDKDRCSGTDCDNLGKTRVHDLKLLLVSTGAAANLLESMTTPDGAARMLDDVAADRAALTGASTLGNVATAHHNACNAMLEKLRAALGKLYPPVKPFIGDLYPSNPTGGWIQKIGQVATRSSLTVGVQYAYDFLKDVVETYTALREQLFGDTTVCCPDRDAFPKHLLLGDLTAPAGSTANRTGYYPSPAVVAASRRLDHARFLFRKLGAIIDGFALPSSGAPIRITPSLFEDRALEERAIPYYYDPQGAIHQWWSHSLRSRGMSDFNYSYYAVDPARYPAKGAAAAPFASQIGRFPFFRVEGHLGKTLSNALADIRSQIKQHNLPFAVHGLLLDPDKQHVIWSGPHYTDLHRMHWLFRHALSDQLDDAVAYARRFKQQISDELSAGQKDAKQIAKHKQLEVEANAKRAAAKLRKSYGEVERDETWIGDFGRAQEAAGQFKQGLSANAKTEFTTPFDTLIGSLNAQLMGRLAELIAGMGEKEKDKHVFATFLDKHPGLEHFGGVSRGGTLVLGYDKSGHVVADFMLPYLLEEVDEPQPEDEAPPIILKPHTTYWPPWLFDKGITLGLSVDDKLNHLWATKHPEIEKEIQAQRDIFLGIRDILRGSGGTKIYAYKEPIVREDDLGLFTNEIQAHVEKIDRLRDRLRDRGRSELEQEHDRAALKVAEVALAESLAKTADVVKGIADVESDEDALAALQTIELGAQTLTDAHAIDVLKKGLNEVSKGASSALQAMLATITRKR